MKKNLEHKTIARSLKSMLNSIKHIGEINYDHKDIRYSWGN